MSAEAVVEVRLETPIIEVTPQLAYFEVLPQTAVIEVNPQTPIIEVNPFPELAVETVQPVFEVTLQETPVVEVSLPQQMIEITHSTSVVEISGSPGPQGTPGEAPIVCLIAPIAMSAHRAIAYCSDDFQLEYADHGQVSQAGKVLGITVTAAPAGELIAIRRSGPIDEPGWNWIPGLVFVGSDGQLTQSPPTSGFLQAIGVAITPTRLIVNPLNPVLL